jgi:hypothetical protein
MSNNQLTYISSHTEKMLFDTAFNKTTWHLQPSIIPFLTPMAVLKKIKKNNAGIRMFTAPVNHNKLDEKKTLQIINTILGNTYQHENELTRQNQDFGLDACVVVGYDDNNLKEKRPENTVRMKVLHSEQTELN